MPKKSGGSHDSPCFRPLLDVMWAEGILEGFKIPPLPTFNDMINPEQHV